MKPILFVLLFLITISSFSQDYPFVKEFAEGAVIFRDGTQKAGFVSWNLHQNARLKFRESPKGETTKYSPEDIACFIVGGLEFASIFNFNACAGDYPIIGKTNRFKHTFAQVIDTGKFNVYRVHVATLEALSGGVAFFTNFLIQKTADANMEMVPYPVAIRMREGKYEKAKKDLYVLFKDYPNITEAIKKYTRTDSFYTILDLVHEVNVQPNTQ